MLEHELQLYLDMLSFHLGKLQLQAASNKQRLCPVLTPTNFMWAIQ